MSAAASVPPGTEIGGRFLLDAYLGTGALGELYRATDQKTQKVVAIRLLASDLTRSEAVLEELREQVKAASTLTHKNVVKVFGMGKEGSLRYIAMEHVDGQSLRALLDRKRQGGKTFSLKGAYNVVAHICNALDYAHATMIHGLVGPGTVLINRAGRVKVAEFGLACALAPGSAAVARLTDAYCMAPEMIHDPSSAGPAADIYSLGAILYELLTSHPPGEPLEPMHALVAGVPAPAEDVVWRCLSPNPADRFADAQQVKAAFYAAVQASGDLADADFPAAHSEAHVSSHKSSAPPAPQPPVAAPPVRAPAPRAAAPAPQAPQPQPQPRIDPEVRLQQLLADPCGDNSERWLVHKNRLDFGPFSMLDLKRQLYRGDFSGDDQLLDQETGQRAIARQHPLLQEFVALVERLHQSHRHQKAELEDRHKARKHRTVIVVTVLIVLAILGAGGAVTFYVLRRQPEVREKIVYKDKTGEAVPNLKGIEVSWQAEPPEQAKARKLRKPKKKKAGGAAGDDSTNLGDATQGGGDELLSQKVVQQVMQANLARLTPCVLQEARRDGSLRRVEIDFGVKGTGKVSSVKVNGQSASPFQVCVAGRMKAIQFPTFDGQLTRASFSMNLKY
ncbi:MAG: serine/threonine protein kinase [Deltaproteobacteria bacterium]|nr:serine/threonine protein kinase [Deltaproteobacteria bacterium]